MRVGFIDKIISSIIVINSEFFYISGGDRKIRTKTMSFLMTLGLFLITFGLWLMRFGNPNIARVLTVIGLFLLLPSSFKYLEDYAEKRLSQDQA